DPWEPAPEPREPAAEAIDRHGGDQERDRQPRRVGREQSHAPADLARRHPEAEDPAEDRTEAGGPAGSKRHPHQEGTEETDRLAIEVHPTLPLDRRDPEDAGGIDAEDHEHHAADAREGLLVEA